MVGSSEMSDGGVTSVIKLIKKMPIWEKYNCGWLGTQIQGAMLLKLKLALKSTLKAPFIIPRYDIVHFHTTPDKLGLLIQMPELLLAKLFGKKVIMHIHVGNQLEWNTNNGLFKWCLRRADAIVCLAHRFKKILEEKYLDVKTPAKVVYNACDKVKFLDYSQHEKYILFAGRFNDNKGGWVLIKAFAMICEKFPKWKLVMLGDGPDKPMYEKLVNENNLHDKVLMPGFKYGEELADKYRNAGIFVLASHYEGFPMVVLEAWQYGVPVVTTPVGGLPDVLQEDKNSCVFDYDNAEELAYKLSHLMNNDSLRKEMSEYCRKFSSEMFSIESVNKQFDELYSTL